MSKRFSRILQLFTAILTAVLSASCTTIRESSPSSGLLNREAGTTSWSEMTSLQRSLIESADWALGRRNLKVNDRNFNMDCTGVVMAIYYKSGVDLSDGFDRYTGRGVERLHKYLEYKDLLYKTDFPVPGDLLFWDNTYDQNNDGVINDELTHVGMVVRTDKQGNVEYIHHNYRRGIVLASMNLLDPDNIKLNSPMRARNAEKGHLPKWLSSHLLRDTGRAYDIPSSL